MCVIRFCIWSLCYVFVIDTSNIASKHLLNRPAQCGHEACRTFVILLEGNGEEVIQNTTLRLLINRHVNINTMHYLLLTYLIA